MQSLTVPLATQCLDPALLLQNGRVSLSLKEHMENFWAKKPMMQREFFAHEYDLEEGGSSNTWKGLFRQLENLLVFDDPGLELYINSECYVFNRYRTVLPYVSNRVLLSDPCNDYINASYVSVEKVYRNYIVTQGPLPNTVLHFWQMVWEQRSMGIVMLCHCEENGSSRCANYWPTGLHSCVLVGHFMVECIKSTHRDSYTVSSLEIQNLETGETRTVLHFHYLDWEDFGVPQDTMSFLHFLLDVRSSGVLRPGAGPAVVHCSAGVGRSGVFTLVDICLSFMERAGSLNGLNVTDILLDLRRQRLGLVKTPEQLRFVYTAIFTAHRALGLGQTTEQLKKEVEDVMAAYVPPVIVLPPPKLVYVRPYVEDNTKTLSPTSHPLEDDLTPYPKPATPNFSLSDLDSDSLAEDEETCPPAHPTFCKPPSPQLYGSLLSITSVESSDMAEGLGDGNEQKLKVKGSWWKKMKNIFHQKIRM